VSYPAYPEFIGSEPCMVTDAELFTAEQGDHGAARQARWLCSRCPSIVPCLAWAVPQTDLLGIVGGTTAQERREIRRRRQVTA
jgi:hypothetical protein